MLTVSGSYNTMCDLIHSPFFFGLNKLIDCTMRKGSVAISHILLTVYMLFSNGFTIKNKLVSTVTLKIDGVDDPVGEIQLLYLILKIDI